GTVGDRQARGHAAAQDGEAEDSRLSQAVGGPVDPSEPVPLVLACHGREGRAVAAPHIDDDRRAAEIPVAQHPGQHPGLAPGPVRPRAERDTRGLVELLKRVARRSAPSGGNDPNGLAACGGCAGLAACGGCAGLAACGGCAGLAACGGGPLPPLGWGGNRQCWLLPSLIASSATSAKPSTAADQC